MQQLRLQGIDPPQHVKPAADRAEPVLWVRRIRVLRELLPGEEHVVRDVELRRGLNIVWAAPGDPTSDNALFRSGMAGHSAGKTTFCRLIRHALGEGGFAAEATRRRIREALPSGWLLAEVVLAGRPWTVARPFGRGPRAFCVEAADADEVLARGERQEYAAFLDVVGNATTAALPASRLPTREEGVGWSHILPWLTRDQECRFSDFLEWRHSTSDSDAPALNADERQFLVRSVLGLITDEERIEQERNATLLVRKKQAAHKEPLLAHQAGIDHARVQQLFGMELAPPSSGLFGTQARTELERRKADLAARLAESAASDRRASLQAALEHAVEVEVLASRDVQEAEDRLAFEQATAEHLAARARGEKQSDLLATFPPPRDYCNVPIRLAREHGCPLAKTRPVDLAEVRSERSVADELDAQWELVRALESNLAQKRSAHEAAQTATRDARRASFAAATAFDEERVRLLEEKALLVQAERLVTEAEQAWSRSIEQAETIRMLGAEIEVSYARQEEIRRAVRQALGDFSATFDYVLRALLGDEVRGRVDASGRSLSLVVEYRGERDSAALASVKLLAFDLAAMTESVQGRGCFPRLLLHDGPREADMAAEVYERLFLYAQSLEECFSGEPGFQYIVTTTTRPPTEFLRDPWLRLPLAGVPAEERLLRMDL